MKRIDFLKSACGCGLGLAGGASMLASAAWAQTAADGECESMKRFKDVWIETLMENLEKTLDEKSLAIEPGSRWENGYVASHTWKYQEEFLKVRYWIPLDSKRKNITRTGGNQWDSMWLLGRIGKRLQQARLQESTMMKKWGTSIRPQFDRQNSSANQTSQYRQ
jgi:hypothetical protein